MKKSNSSRQTFFSWYKCHLLVNLPGVRLNLLDNRHQLVEEPLAGVQSQQVLLLEQEAQAVAFRPAQAVARRCRHGGDGMLDVDRGAWLT